MSRSVPDAARPDRADALASAVRKIKWRVLPLFVAMFIVIARLDEESEIDAILAGGISDRKSVV